jgi:CheY-like chemotaxis protein
MTLLVENNDLDAELASSVPTSRGHECVGTGPRWGWRRSTTFLHVVNMQQGNVHDLPVFVLLDLEIPKISGLKVLEAIRADESIRHLPVIILTSSGEGRDRLGAYNHLANSYVVHPLDYDQL